MHSTNFNHSSLKCSNFQPNSHQKPHPIAASKETFLRDLQENFQEWLEMVDKKFVTCNSRDHLIKGAGYVYNSIILDSLFYIFFFLMTSIHAKFLEDKKLIIMSSIKI